MAILDSMPTSEISEIVMKLHPRLYIDFVRYLPPEVCLKILEYLDPVALINVAQTCRSWYALAYDRKLWERLYHLEGWDVISSEIKLWHERVNRVYTLRRERIPADEDSHPHKKRAILKNDEDGDHEMADAFKSIKVGEDSQGASLFGSPAWSHATSVNAGLVPLDHGMTSADVDMESAEKGKGVDTGGLDFDFNGMREESPLPMDKSRESLFLESVVPQTLTTGLPLSTLWIYEPRHHKYIVNWKYLYSMRRRLESNWELCKYTNFQFPHPDHPDEGHQECVYSLQFTSEYLVSGSRDRSIRIWNMRSHRLVLPPLLAHNASVLCLQFDADPEEDLIVSGSSDSDVILWRFSTGQVIQKLRKAHSESVLNVKFDKRILVTCSKDKTIKIFNRRPLRYGDVGYPHAEAVNPVPRHMRNYGYDVDLANELPVIDAYSMIGNLIGHRAAVNAVHICGEEIVSASGDKGIKVWNWPKQVCTRTILGHTKGIACVQYDGRRIVSGSSDNEVKVFDSTTGLEVASLLAHANLVRTVQAGFGDTMFSPEEDEELARKVDERYFKAVENGEIPEVAAMSRQSRRRPRNPGSMRPEDITAFGAKLPPGGGGGKYARIVSGSYDACIIIWRRDKEGIWKDVHRLRQDEAAAASRRPPAAPPHPPDGGGGGSGPNLHPSMRAGVMVHLHALRQQPTEERYHAFIDWVVSRGVPALEQALASHHILLNHHSYLQRAIDRVPAPHARSLLRQAVENAQNARAEGASQGGRATRPAASSSTAASQAGSSVPQNAGVSPHIASAVAVMSDDSDAGSSTTATARPGNAQAAQAQSAAQGGASTSANGQAVQNAQGTQNNGQIQGHHHHHGQGAQQGGAQPHHHHPHIADDANPARVFKLQFDARRIICCSQTSVIVGWDFCNGDPELDAVARFFAPVE